MNSARFSGCTASKFKGLKKWQSMQHCVQKKKECAVSSPCLNGTLLDITIIMSSVTTGNRRKDQLDAFAFSQMHD